MSDQTPRWDPPGGASGEDETPPPPPPAAPGTPPSSDASTPDPSWPPPDPDSVYGGRTVYGGDGGSSWEPPPPPRRRTGLVVGIVLGVLALVLVLGGLVFIGVRQSGTAGQDGPTETAEEFTPPTAEGGDVESQADALLTTIDRSELRMIKFQEDVFAEIGEDGMVGDRAEAVANAAQAAGDDLTRLRSGLQDLAEGEGEDLSGLRAVRDTYTQHLDAWIEYVDAVAATPTLAGGSTSGAEAYWRDINLTGADFVDAMAEQLPEGLPSELQDLADQIVERGFGGYDQDPSGDLV